MERLKVSKQTKFDTYYLNNKKNLNFLIFNTRNISKNKITYR